MVADDAVCYRHRDRQAATGCQRCDRPICPECMHAASVGFHCPECTKAGSQRVYRPGDLVTRPLATFVIMGLCVLTYLAQESSSGRVTDDLILFGPAIGDAGARIGSEVVRGQWWRLISSGFLHAGILHIALNMYALYLFGPVVERAMGWARFLLVYAGGLLGGSLAVVAFNFDTASLGASGAVLGLAGGLAGVLAAQGRSIFQTSLGGIFLINLLLPLIPGFNISFWGHFGGIVGGFVVAMLLTWVPAQLGRSKQAQALSIAAAAALIVAMGVGAVVIANRGGIVTIL